MNSLPSALFDRAMDVLKADTAQGLLAAGNEEVWREVRRALMDS